MQCNMDAKIAQASVLSPGNKYRLRPAHDNFYHFGHICGVLMMSVVLLDLSLSMKKGHIVRCPCSHLGSSHNYSYLSGAC